MAQNGVIAAQLPAEKIGDSLPRQVMLGGSKSAARDNQRHATQRIAKRFGKQIAVVADNGLAHHLDTNGIQLLGKEERVGVQAVRREQLRTNCDDLRFHLGQSRESGSLLPLFRRSYAARKFFEVFLQKCRSKVLKVICKILER